MHLCTQYRNVLGCIPTHAHREREREREIERKRERERDTHTPLQVLDLSDNALGDAGCEVTKQHQKQQESCVYA